MTHNTRMSAEEARHAQLDEWYEKYGLVGMIRKIQEQRLGTGDYTAERRLRKDPPLEEIIAQLNEQHRARGEDESP